MAKSCIISKAFLFLLCLITNIVSTHAPSQQGLPFQAPTELSQKLIRNPLALSQASTDFGHIIHKNPLAIFSPSSIHDISKLVKFSNSLQTPFTIAPRGQAHSPLGQSMTHDGIVVNMTHLNDGDAIFIVPDKKGPPYADVGGGQIWVDVLHSALERGLTPLSLTDYLYLSIGGTLSNAGISGHSFRFGPQISNVLELDVVTGKGELVTCSPQNNSELFNAVLGGLGQFGIITRARIALGPAPTRVKWLHLLYSDFSAFSGDQKRLISMNGRNDANAANYVEGLLLLYRPQLVLSFYPKPDQPRIMSLVTKHRIMYILELVKYYDNSTKHHIDEDVGVLVKGLKFIPTFMFKKDVGYEEFLNRVHADELVLKSVGLWEVPHPWLILFVPGSRISDFDEGVFNGIIFKRNISTGAILLYPMNRTKWDDNMSAVTPDEEIFYVVSFLHSTGHDQLKEFEAQNQQILQFCKDAGIGIKQYLPHNKTHDEWMQHFGPKWKLFQENKDQFDPNRILSPGQGIFNGNV